MEIHTRITHQTLPMSFDITMWQNQQKSLEIGANVKLKNSAEFAWQK